MSDKLLLDLLDVFGPSGFEEQALDVFKSAFTDEFEFIENMYNLCLAKPKKEYKKNIVIYSHIDEIGFAVREITDEGFLKVAPIGGIDSHLLLSREVVVQNEEGELIDGVFGAVPIHLLEDEHREILVNDLYVDICAKDKEEVEGYKINIGCPIGFKSSARVGSNQKVISKSVDNRAGAYAAIQAALKTVDLDNVGISVVATCQEENGLHGADMASNFLRDVFKPDFNIVIDGTFSMDCPDADNDKWGNVGLGKGPVVSMGSVNNKGLIRQIKKIAVDNNIPIQLELSSEWSGTDADKLFLMNGGGVPTILISIPVRYVHTPNEMFDMVDLLNLIKLITLFAAEQNK